MSHVTCLRDPAKLLILTDIACLYFFFWFYFQRNTFQAVLASDDNITFVIFLYDKIQWTWGYSAEGIPAQVDTYDIVWLSVRSVELGWRGTGLMGHF